MGNIVRHVLRVIRDASNDEATEASFMEHAEELGNPDHEDEEEEEKEEEDDDDDRDDKTRSKNLFTSQSHSVFKQSTSLLDYSAKDSSARSAGFYTSSSSMINLLGDNGLRQPVRERMQNILFFFECNQL